MGADASEQPVPAADGIDIHMDELYLLVCPDCGEQVVNIPLTEGGFLIREGNVLTGGNAFMCFCLNSTCQPRAIIMAPKSFTHNHIAVIEGVAGQRAIVEAMRTHERNDPLHENLRNAPRWRKLVDDQETRLKALEVAQ